MRLFISAGEPSGDVHAANLIRSIRERCPNLEVVGFGGPQMTAAGAKLIYPLVELALMWFLRVLINLPKFFNWPTKPKRISATRSPRQLC